MVSAQALRIILNSERIHGTSNTSSASIQNMGIDHRRLHVAMAQKFLGGSDIVAIFQQISGKGMAGAQGFAEAVQKFECYDGPGCMARVLSNWIRRDWYGVSLWHGLSSSLGGK